MLDVELFFVRKMKGDGSIRNEHHRMYIIACVESERLTAHVAFDF